MQWLRKLIRKFVGQVNNSDSDYEYDKVPDNRLYRKSIQYPWLRRRLIECSIQEDDENCYYNSLLTIVAEHCLGTMPRVRLSLRDNFIEDNIEDKWAYWGSNNEIGSALRRLRRDACLTGIGIAIPYTKETALDEVKLCLRNVPATKLRSPAHSSITDRIINGIEYNEDWDPIKIYIENDDKLDVTAYDIKDILFWYKNTEFVGTPECGPAFTVYPSVRRYLNAVIRGEELRESIALGIEQDPQMYAPADKALTGKFEYEPGQVLALPPGTKLTGVAAGTSSGDKSVMLKVMVSAAARCVMCPGNLALGDSSGHNMATAQVDIQPWKIRVDNDRFDFQPVLVKTFWFWYEEARRLPGYLESTSKRLIRSAPLDWSYNVLFHHPDPGKMANARATDLASGAATLSMIYDSIDKKARRELEKEAKMLGIPILDLYKILLESRTKVQIYTEPDSNGEEENNRRTGS